MADNEIHDDKLREFARTRGLDWPQRGRVGAKTKDAVRAAFKAEWDAAGVSVAKAEARLETLRAKSFGHLVDYTTPGNANPTVTEPVAPQQ